MPFNGAFVVFPAFRASLLKRDERRDELGEGESLRRLRRRKGFLAPFDGRIDTVNVETLSMLADLCAGAGEGQGRILAQLEALGRSVVAVREVPDFGAGADSKDKTSSLRVNDCLSSSGESQSGYRAVGQRFLQVCVPFPGLRLGYGKTPLPVTCGHIVAPIAEESARSLLERSGIRSSGATQNPVGFTPREGSIPSSGTNKIRRLRDSSGRH